MEPRKPIYVARTVANGVDPKVLAVPFLILLAMSVSVMGIGLLPLMLLALIVLLGVIGMAMRRASRLEWDGQQLHWVEWPKRRLLAERGDGAVVRVALTAGGLAGGKPVNFLVWLDRDGRARSPFMPERLWDPVQLERLRNAAWMPMYDDASTSLKDVGTRYPGSVPWYVMNPAWMVIPAIPLAILLFVLFTPH